MPERCPQEDGPCESSCSESGGSSHCIKYRDGNRRQRWESFKTAKAADRGRREVESQLDNDRFVDPKDLKRTVGEAWESFRATRWDSIRKTTQSFYEGALSHPYRADLGAATAVTVRSSPRLCSFSALAVHESPIGFRLVSSK